MTGGSIKEYAEAVRKRGSVPKVVEKQIGISYPVKERKNMRASGSPRKGGYTDGRRISQWGRVDYGRPEALAGEVGRPAAGVKPYKICGFCRGPHSKSGALDPALGQRDAAPLWNSSKRFPAASCGA